MPATFSSPETITCAALPTLSVLRWCKKIAQIQVKW
jgi:hypothetical protein